MGTNLTVTHVEDRAQLSELDSEWEQLLGGTDVASPFLTPGWQSAWLETYGTAHRPFVLTARREGELVGLWPLALTKRGPFRVLEPVGAGRSDWLDIPVISGLRESVLAEFVQYLRERSDRWDLIDCRDVLADSPTLPIIERLCAGEGIAVRRQARSVAPYLPLVGTWEQFLDTKRSKFRSNLKYYRRLTERSGQHLEIRQIDWKQKHNAVDDLAAVELNSWKARDGNLKVSTPVGREFYRRFCDHFAGREALEVWTAEIDGAPVAFVLNIIYGDKCYHYNTCYDEQFGYISPGLLLHADAIRTAFERNLREYDFLSGDEPYKDRWCMERRGIDHVAFAHHGLVSRVASAILVQARWALRRNEFLRKGRQRILAATRRLLRQGTRE